MRLEAAVVPCTAGLAMPTVVLRAAKPAVTLHTQHRRGTFSVDACRGSAARETTWPCSLISRPCSSRRSGAARKAFGFAGGAPGSPGCPGIPIAGTLPKPGTTGRPAKFCVSAAAACCAAASTAGCAPDGGAAGAACAAFCVDNPCTPSLCSSHFVHAKAAHTGS